MWHGHDGRLLHVGMLVEHLLDLARVDVVAAPDDQVLLAIHDEEVPVLVDLGHVAGAEPAGLVDRVRRRLRALPVALHDVVAADHDLAHLALRDLLAVLVPDLHLDALDRRADRSRLALAAGVVERRDRGGLRQPVSLEDDAAELLLEAADQLHGDGGAAGHADAQARRVGRVRGVRVQHRVVHRRHALEDGHAVALDDLERLVGVEAREHRHLRAAAHGGVHRAGLAEGVEQRQRSEQHLVLVELGESASTLAQLRFRFAWVSSAPLGCPVVPLV